MIVQCNDDVMDSYIDAKQDCCTEYRILFVFRDHFWFSKKPVVVPGFPFKTSGNLVSSSKECIKKKRKNKRILLHLTNLGADCPVKCAWCALREWSPVLGRSPCLIRVD